MKDNGLIQSVYEKAVKREAVRLEYEDRKIAEEHWCSLERAPIDADVMERLTDAIRDGLAESRDARSRENVASRLLKLLESQAKREVPLSDVKAGVSGPQGRVVQRRGEEEAKNREYSELAASIGNPKAEARAIRREADRLRESMMNDKPQWSALEQFAAMLRTGLQANPDEHVSLDIGRDFGEALLAQIEAQ